MMKITLSSAQGSINPMTIIERKLLAPWKFPCSHLNNSAANTPYVSRAGRFIQSETRIMEYEKHQQKV